MPIIFLTAAGAEPELTFRGYAAGAVDYISKPFDPWVLRAKVSVFVDLYLKDRQLRLASGLLPRLAAVEEAAAGLAAVPARPALRRLRTRSSSPTGLDGGCDRHHRELAPLDGRLAGPLGLEHERAGSAVRRLARAARGLPAGHGVLPDTRAGTPATTQWSGMSPRTTEPAATTTLRPMLAPGRTIAPAPSHEPDPDADRAVDRELAADRGVRVLVAVVLVGDVDVRAGPDVIADRHRLVRHDVAAPADHAPVADREHGPAGRGPGRAACPPTGSPAGR